MLDFYDVKGALEKMLDALGLLKDTCFEGAGLAGYLHPKISAQVVCKGIPVGSLGSLIRISESFGISSRMFSCSK